MTLFAVALVILGLASASSVHTADDSVRDRSDLGLSQGHLRGEGSAGQPRRSIAATAQQNVEVAAAAAAATGGGKSARKNITGTLVYLTMDNVKQYLIRDSTTGAMVYLWTGYQLPLTDAEGNNIVPGATISLDCVFNAATGVCTPDASSKIVVKVMVASTPAAVGASVSQSLLVMIIDYPSCGVRASLSESNIRDMYLGTSRDGNGGIAQKYSQCSYGKFTLNPSTFRAVVVPLSCQSSQINSCDWNSMAPSADATARSSIGSAFDRFSHYSYVLPPALQSKCSWAGLAYLPGTQTWLQTSSYGVYRWATVMQEGIHNYGLVHSWQNDIEYNDYSTAMGRGDACPNAAEISRMGWATPASGADGMDSNALRPGSATAFVLPATYLTGNNNYLRVKPDWLSSYARNLYIAVRVAKNGDASLGSSYASKVNIHEVNAEMDNGYFSNPGAWYTRDRRITFIGAVPTMSQLTLSSYKLVVYGGSWTNGDYLRVYVCRYNSAPSECPPVQDLERGRPPPPPPGTVGSYLVNLAVGSLKTVASSAASYVSPMFATDGDLTSLFHSAYPGSYSAGLTTDYTPFVGIQLKQLSYIEKIVIWNRPGFEGRLYNSEVRVGTTSITDGNSVSRNSLVWKQDRTLGSIITINLSSTTVVGSWVSLQNFNPDRDEAGGCDWVLNILEVQVFGLPLLSVQRTVASSVDAGSNAAYATDGDLSTLFHSTWPGSYSAGLTTDYTPYIGVQLAQPSYIKKVIVWNRPGFEGRLFNSEVRAGTSAVSDGNSITRNALVWKQDSSNVGRVAEIDPSASPLIGSWVSLQNFNPDRDPASGCDWVLNILEMQVFGLPLLSVQQTVASSVAAEVKVEYATDGDLTTLFHSAYPGSVLSGLATDYSPYVGIQLKQLSYIEKIVIWNRPGFEGRLQNSEVRVGTTSITDGNSVSRNRLVWKQDGVLGRVIEVNLNFNTPVAGNWVSFQNFNSDRDPAGGCDWVLNILEIQVFGRT